MEKYYINLLAVLALCSLVFSQTPDVEFTIDEELAVSTEVGQLDNIQNLFSDLSEEVRSSLQYGILDHGSSPASLFNITRNVGIISVAKRIDREEMCLVVENCSLKINILASAQNSTQFNSRVITVYFTIMDINDNSPTFDRSSVVLKVPDGSSVDTVLKVTAANDKDFTPEYKVKNYSMNSALDVFSLSASQTLDGSSEIQLRLKRSLDREKVDKYEFTITAYDGGSLPRTSTLLVTVDVTDVNDNEPIFQNKTYNLTIDSKTSLNTVILQVSATDADEGENALLTYNFSNFHKPVLENVFRINSTTGEISVAGPLRSGKFEFIVEAQDSGSPRLKTQTMVSVSVVNSENNPPRISLTTLGSSSNQNAVSVLEPGGKGFFVAFVLIDDDGGANVICNINDDFFTMVPVGNKGYTIVLQGAVDREIMASYDLTVICQDEGDLPLNTTLQFRVNIEDANDNAPVFSQQRYSRTISEGKKTGEYMLQVTASDNDTGLNAAVRYSLDPVYDPYFSIDPKTGIISAVGDLDRETYPVMILKVYATDQGKPKQKQSSAEVSIVLEDINDNIPEFAKKVFIFSAIEEVEGERIIANLVAHDSDEGLNSELQYFFTGSENGADRVFTVLQNGSIISSAKLNREKKSNYTFSVMVRDKGDPPLKSSAASVVVEVADINDNTPIILFPKSQNYTLLISSVPETGVVLSRIVAYDNDAGENGSLKYTLVSGNEDGAFEISETAGEFKIAQSSRLKNNKRYDIGIVVADRGFPPKFKTTFLKVDVLYNNVTQELAKGYNENQEDYIIIIAAVAAVTVVLSTLIIVTICVVFQRDKTSERKHALKGTFKNIPIPENLGNKEKVTNVVSQNIVTANPHQYSMNNLSSPSQSRSHIINKTGIYFQVRDDNPNSQYASAKVKSVSFILEKSEMVSAATRHIFNRNDFQHNVNYGSPSRRSSVENTFHPGSSLREQGDDVISDTSGDTTTSDSGRGNSVDDVNFDQIIEGDHSSSITSRRHSDDIKGPNNTQTVAENSRRSSSSHHFRFAQNSSKAVPPERPHNYRLQTNFENKLLAPACNPEGAGYAQKRFLSETNNYSSRPPSVTTFRIPRQLSMTSVDDDASTTTSGSYVINPDEIRIDTFVGADIVV